MKTRSLAAALVGVWLTTMAAAAGPDFASLELVGYSPPKPAPAFALPDLQGRTLRLDELRGKVVLLFFWATW